MGGIAENLSDPTSAITPQPISDPLAQIPGLVKGIKPRLAESQSNTGLSEPLNASLREEFSSNNFSQEDEGADQTGEDLDDSAPIAQPMSAPISPEPAIAQPSNSPSTKPSRNKQSEEKAIAPSLPDDLSTSGDEPHDLSSLIALTDVEMDRIGWTKLEGRDYLKQTYGKATRQRLEVDELLDFLNYLRALPSPYGL
jgi:hypothetical protein